MPRSVPASAAPGLAYLPYYLEAMAGSLPTDDELRAFLTVVGGAENAEWRGLSDE